MITWGHWLFGLTAGLVGACIGSFLNVLIYRWPRQLSLGDPKRSFCPHCKALIPWYRNVPVLTWVLQGGRCACCGGGIAWRYVAVEGLNAAWWVLCWRMVAPGEALLAMLLGSVLLVVSAIDIEHTLVPVVLCWVAAAAAIAGGWFAPGLLRFGWDVVEPRWTSSAAALVGWLAGYGILLLTVWLGKKAFGVQKLVYEDGKEAHWELREPLEDGDELHFVLGDEAVPWSDLFFRPANCLLIDAKELEWDAKAVGASRVAVFSDKVEIGAELVPLEALKSLRGLAREVQVPREAMGAGDPPLLAMIGAFIGLPGVLFTLFASSVYALLVAMLARIGFGRQLPYGPFLALGAVTWLLGGWKLWAAYFGFLGF